MVEKIMINNDNRHIIESLPIGVIVTDLKGNIVTNNQHAELIINTNDSVGIDGYVTLLKRQEGSLFEKFIDSGCTAEYPVQNIKINNRILEIMGAPLKGGGGVVSGAVFVLRDITEIEKRHELEMKNEKYSAIGELAADIAHEIRNPLGSIELFASLLKKESKRQS